MKHFNSIPLISNKRHQNKHEQFNENTMSLSFNGNAAVVNNNNRTLSATVCCIKINSL